MTAEIIVYALVAAGLVFWLRSILGTHQEDEPGSPYARAEIKDEKTIPKDPETGRAIISAEDKIMDLARHPTGTLAVENKTAENALIEISRADKNFDIVNFLEAAQDAFVIIVESFAEGDRETLKDLLEDSVFQSFDTAIAEREQNGETLETEIHSIRRAEVIEAHLEGRTAFVTVKFTADETTVTKDRDGEILSGHPEKTTKMTDIWTFGREVKSRDPRWLLYATRGDFDGDSETIPDTE